MCPGCHMQLSAKFANHPQVYHTQHTHHTHTTQTPRKQLDEYPGTINVRGYILYVI